MSILFGPEGNGSLGQVNQELDLQTVTGDIGDQSLKAILLAVYKLVDFLLHPATVLFISVHVLGIHKAMIHNKA